MKIYEYRAKEILKGYGVPSKGVGPYLLSRTSNFECGWGSGNSGVSRGCGEAPDGASRITASVF